MIDGKHKALQVEEIRGVCEESEQHPYTRL